MASQKEVIYDGDRLYFAYGSNLNVAQMAQRCPSSIFIGKGTLPGYRWFINERGVANIAESPSDYVEGLLFAISEEDEQTLDRNEGVAKDLYQKRLMDIDLTLLEDDEWVRCKTSKLAAKMEELRGDAPEAPPPRRSVAEDRGRARGWSNPQPHFDPQRFASSYQDKSRPPVAYRQPEDPRGRSVSRKGWTRPAKQRFGRQQSESRVGNYNRTESKTRPPIAYQAPAGEFRGRSGSRQGRDQRQSESRTGRQRSESRQSRSSRMSDSNTGHRNYDQVLDDIDDAKLRANKLITRIELRIEHFVVSGLAWLHARSARREGEMASGFEGTVPALVYISHKFSEPGHIREEYVERMEHAMEDALNLGVSAAFIQKYMLPSVKSSLNRQAERRAGERKTNEAQRRRSPSPQRSRSAQRDHVNRSQKRSASAGRGRASPLISEDLFGDSLQSFSSSFEDFEQSLKDETPAKGKPVRDERASRSNETERTERGRVVTDSKTKREPASRATSGPNRSEKPVRDSRVTPKDRAIGEDRADRDRETGWAPGPERERVAIDNNKASRTTSGPARGEQHQQHQQQQQQLNRDTKTVQKNNAARAEDRVDRERDNEWTSTPERGRTGRNINNAGRDLTGIATRPPREVQPSRETKAEWTDKSSREDSRLDRNNNNNHTSEWAPTPERGRKTSNASEWAPTPERSRTTKDNPASRIPISKSGREKKTGLSQDAKATTNTTTDWTPAPERQAPERPSAATTNSSRPARDTKRSASKDDKTTQARDVRAPRNNNATEQRDREARPNRNYHSGPTEKNEWHDVEFSSDDDEDNDNDTSWSSRDGDDWNSRLVRGGDDYLIHPFGTFQGNTQPQRGAEDDQRKRSSEDRRKDRSRQDFQVVSI